MPLSVFVSTFAFIPQCSFVTLFLIPSLIIAPGMLLRALIATALILLSCFFCGAQLSLPRIDVGSGTGLCTAGRAIGGALQLLM